MFSQLHIQISQTPQQPKKGQPFDNCKGFSASYSKKKIGDYAYYLNDLIGSGYSSQVYKCFHREQPNITYAIKVINLSKLAKANLNLLRDEIKILQTLNHPNIIKFHNFYFTENNCYLVTDFCQGGTLQEHIERKKNLNYEEIFDQLIQGCKYLEEKLIVHRDIKPANVFLKGSQWKIGDFGFARFIEGEETMVKQLYKVGSPLYMPPETLSNSIYSLKTDSFALGVTVFYMVTKKFPWVGSNNKQLLENYKNNAFPSYLLQNVSMKMQKHIEDLCQLDINQRILIKDIDNVVVKNPEQKINQQTIRKKVSQPCIPERYDYVVQTFQQQDLETMSLEKLKGRLGLDIIQRIKLTKFVHYLIANIKQFDSLGPLREKLERLLKLLTVFFQWIDNPTFLKYLNEFNCSHVHQYESIKELCQLREDIRETIENLSTEKQNTKLILCRLKLIQLRHIMRLAFDKNISKLHKYINKCTLHPDFSKIYFQPFQVTEIERLA